MLKLHHFEAFTLDVMQHGPRIEVTTDDRGAQHRVRGYEAKLQILQARELTTHEPGAVDAETAAVIPEEAQIRIDGTPRTFQLVRTRSGASWVAWRRHGEVWLTVAARDLAEPDLELEVVDGPLPRSGGDVWDELPV